MKLYTAEMAKWRSIKRGGKGWIQKKRHFGDNDKFLMFKDERWQEVDLNKDLPDLVYQNYCGNDLEDQVWKEYIKG